MTLKATRRVALRGQGRIETTRTVYRVPLPTAEGCRACPWLGAMDRCCHPGHGCPRGAHRIRPWEHPVPCPEGVKKKLEIRR